jgi:NTE family protein
MTAAGQDQLAESHRADGVFEGGGVKGLAFAGAVQGAEDAGLGEWVNVAGTSAGAIVAALLVAGHDGASLKAILDDTDYRRFADYGPGGKFFGGGLNALRFRGVARGRYFEQWLGEQLAARLGRPDPAFGDLIRQDLPDDITDAQREKAKYRLRVIASDITEGRMLVLPDDLADYEDDNGRALEPDTFPVVKAVRMSMSFPYFFNPVTLRKRGRAHLIVDGGILSNFPIWLFDSHDAIKRWTFGFRLYGGRPPEEPPYRPCPKPLWPIHLTKAMFLAATEAWDRKKLSEPTAVRTISIPTGNVRTLNFELTEAERTELYTSGLEAARKFFAGRESYMNSLGRRAQGPAVALAASGRE